MLRRRLLFRGSDAMTQKGRIERRVIATEFVTEVNSQTHCAHCDGQPIEWHREGHEQQPNARVSSLRTQGSSIERIQREMDVCMPLCRSCHMKEDGRSVALRSAAPHQKGQLYVVARSCDRCGRMAKPLRKGNCWSCSETVRCGGRFHKDCDLCRIAAVQETS